MLASRPFALGCAALLATGAPLCAEDPAKDSAPVTREEFDRLARELEDLKKKGLSAAAAPGAPAEARGTGGLYDTRPALTGLAAHTYVGGYFDVQFHDAENAHHELALERIVPFFAADIHDRVKFATEIEIEDGHEVEVEFATLDLILWKGLNLRGGVILDPLGRFNLLHDSPINDLTDRPLVDQFVIPSTLREVGVGFFGSLTPESSQWQVKYEGYVTSGFKGLSNDVTIAPTITHDEGLREARPHEEGLGTEPFHDNNNAFAGVGRVSVSPALGTELGVSAHHGAYDDRGDNALTIAAADALFTVPRWKAGKVPVGPIELLAEGAYAFIERDSFAKARGVPDDFWGYYGQVSWHFLIEDFLPEGSKLTTAFFPDSVFTLVGRWDHVDLDGAILRRATVGINFRPVESTVLKLDYQFNSGKGKADPTADDDVFLVSIASYF